MKGMSAVTGKPLEGEAHLVQSIRDILSTPIGSRVALRDYGSLLPRLIDQPYNSGLRQRIFAATAIALARWEKRIVLSRVGLSRSEEGAFTLSIEGRRTDVPTPNSLTRLTVPLAGSLSSAL